MRIKLLAAFFLLTSAGWWPGRAQSAPAQVPNIQLADGGYVRQMVVQPDGKLIIAGRFSAVNGVARRNIARINPNGSVDVTWDPNPRSSAKNDYGILTLCLLGDDLFVGGRFNRIGGHPRTGLAKISIKGNGAADPAWNPNPRLSIFNGNGATLDGSVYAIATDGSNIFIGGLFDIIGGEIRIGIAKVSADGIGGTDPAWIVPRMYGDGAVTALAVNGSFVYAGARVPVVGGFGGDLFRTPTSGSGTIDPSWNRNRPPLLVYFNAFAFTGTDVFAGGTLLDLTNYAPAGAYLAKYSASGVGNIDAAWTPSFAGTPDHPSEIESLAINGSSIYVGGRFASVNGLVRANLVKLSTSGSGQPDPSWKADAELSPIGGAVAALAIRGTSLLVGGSFRRINGTVALGIASLDTATTEIGDRYRAQVQFTALATAIARQPDGKLLLGGRFFLANGLVRQGLVRVNTDGSIDEGWQPATEDAQINDIAVVENDIFVAGTFTKIGGQPRKGLAKFSVVGPDTADPDWDPNVEGYVGTVHVAGSQVYLGGSFNSVGGVAIHGLARVNAAGSGTLDSSWRPQVSGLREVVSVLSSNSGVFAGSVATVQGAGGPSLQKFTLISGAPEPRFSTSLTKGISALALDGPWIYAGGSRTLARINAESGARDKKFNIVPNEDILVLRVSGTNLYAGGLFSKIGGVERNGLARIDTTGNGRVDRDWNPMPDHIEAGSRGNLSYYGVLPSVGSLLVEGNTVLVAGEFDSIGGEPRLAFAALASARAPVVVRTPDGIVVSRNPADGADVTHFRFTRIAGGTLYLHDGITPITEDDFISVERASEGLVFQPLPGSSERALLVIVSSINDKPSGAGRDSTFVDLTSLQTLPVFTLDRFSYLVNEGAGGIAIEVQKTGLGAAEVNFATTDGSARSGTDYTAVATKLTFGAGETSKTVNVAIANDATFRGDRNFGVTLGSAAGSVLGQPQSASVKIVEDDSFGTAGSRTVINLPNPALPPASAGELSVSLAPAQANGQWRAVGDPLWHGSGAVVTGLASGNFTVEFRAVNGYRVPDSLIAAVTSGQRTNVSANYTALPGDSQTGLLTVRLTPANVAALSTAEASRTQWRRQGEVAWRNSGETITLGTGVYVIEFKPVLMLFEPQSVDIVVAAGQTNSVTGVYVVADTPAAPKPQVVSLAQATTQQPFLFTGQIKADDSFGSGCVVQTHVVLTAAHVVFDDQSLSFATNMKWYFQRHRSQYESPPQTPRGVYLPEGYAAQRASDGAVQEPGISTPASQASDIATLFFLDPPGRGGSAGYLESDAPDNEWLTTARNKMLIGYPIYGVPGNDRGKIHATTAVNLAFNRTYQVGQPVYTTSGISGYPGTCGGPLCAQYSDGNYYPAAVYLGGNAQTLVRSIDSGAVALINRAEASGAGGGNDSGGGAFRGRPGERPSRPQGGSGGIINPEPPRAATPFAPPGNLSCNLGPADAIAAGAGWRVVRSLNYFGLGAQQQLPAGSYQVEFKPVPGFSTPPSLTVELFPSQTTVIDGTYQPADSAIISARRLHAAVEKPFRYEIVATNGAAVFSAGNLPEGLTINPATGVISGLPMEAGIFEARITAGAASAPLTIVIEAPGTLTVVLSGRGTVTPPGFEGTSTRFVGRRFTIKATPPPEMLFDGWSGDKPAATPTLTFTMEDGLVLRANFVPNPYLTRSGAYHGLIRSGSGIHGIAAVILTESGACTIRITLEGGTDALSDRFDTGGAFVGQIKRKKELTPIDVALRLDTAATEPALIGTITVDADTFDLTALRAVFSKTNPAPEAGKHTLILPPDPAQSDPALYPAGHGYALLGIGINGSINAIGQLGDGTPFRTAGFMRADHTWTLFAQPYKGKGLLAGTLMFTQHAAPGIDEIGGPLRWEKPATSKGRYTPGFTGSIATVGSRWTPPEKDSAALDIADWDFVIGQSVFSPALTGKATLDTSNRFTVTPPDVATLKLNPTTGLLTGRFKPAAASKPVNFSGVLLQNQRSARGLFALPDKTGPVTLDPP